MTNKLDKYEKNRANVETRETQNETETRLNNEIENLKIKLEESQVRTSLLEEEKKRSKEQNEVILLSFLLTKLALVIIIFNN